ncbi:phosphoglycerate dehydrogenase-like enzyme [Arthrobacter globiformis]|uniref:hypothetical protein n=1 Tax=Arthrobacter globiformis TaxID=1665 RepID=UPI002787314C|nr:hypothetical protein [Arthrobacter globiformis]MDQ1058415.1 phosphoglycerate dehydrogenase-like enzyme [Arthrobacter globiformis]
MAARILITTDYLHPGDTVDQLLRDHGLEPVYSPSRGPRSPKERSSLFNSISGAILASEPVTADMLTGAASLKVIARSGVGYDSIDVQAAAAGGIRVCNAPGTNHHSVAELTIGLIIMAARRLAEVTTAVRQATGPAKPAMNSADPPWASSATDPVDAPPHNWDRRRHERPGQHRPPRP